MTRSISKLLASLFLIFATSSFGGEYIIKYKGLGFFAQESFSALSLKDYYMKEKLLKVNVPNNDPVILGQLMRHPEVESVVKNFRLHTFRTPEQQVADLREQWALAKVNAEQAWAAAGNTGSKKVTVAVIDTGVDYRHESLASNSVPGYDFNGNDNDPMDETGAQNPGHGTHCAGIVGATGSVDGGVSGAVQNVSIMPIRFLGANGGGDLMAGIRSIDYAIENGADIISASWGARVPAAQAKDLIDAVQRASDAGVIFISAAANDGKNNDATDYFPTNANFANTISVAASGPDDTKPNWSNYGIKKVDDASPALNIESTLPKNKYGKLSGTSMATPLVSGIVAFLKSQEPSLTGAQAKAVLQHTGANVEIDVACDCRVDMEAALELVMTADSYTVPATATLYLGETQKFDATNMKGALSFESTNPTIATVDENGVLTANELGVTTVKVTDEAGESTETLPIRIVEAPQGGGGSCPIGDPALCDLLCQIMPDMPFCE